MGLSDEGFKFETSYLSSAESSAADGTMNQAGRGDVDKTLGQALDASKPVGQMDSPDRFFVQETER